MLGCYAMIYVVSAGALNLEASERSLMSQMKGDAHRPGHDQAQGHQKVSREAMAKELQALIRSSQLGRRPERVAKNGFYVQVEDMDAETKVWRQGLLKPRRDSKAKKNEF